MTPEKMEAFRKNYRGFDPVKLPDGTTAYGRCPRPFNSRPDIFAAEECVAAGECGCGHNVDIKHGGSISAALGEKLRDRANRKTAYSGTSLTVAYYDVFDAALDRDVADVLEAKSAPVAYQQRERRNGEWSDWYPSSKEAFEEMQAKPDPRFEGRALVPA